MKPKPKTVFLSEQAIINADRLRLKQQPPPSLCSFLSYQLETLLTKKQKTNV
jgi:hypothetical protein